jgi:hypothetical protein
MKYINIRLSNVREAPLLTSPSGWQRGKQAVAWVVDVLDDLLGLPVTSGTVDVLEGR